MTHEDLRRMQPGLEEKNPAANAQFLAEVQEGAIKSGGKLNERDVTMLRLRALGYQHDEIGDMLSRSPKTIRNNLGQTYTNIGVADAFEGITWCLENGVILPSQILPEDYEQRLNSLTARERSVLDTVVEIGTTHNKTVGGTIFIAERTSRNYFSKINLKLFTRNALQASAMHMAYTMSRPTQPQ